jgi:hypothetical protein
VAASADRPDGRRHAAPPPRSVADGRASVRDALRHRHLAWGRRPTPEGSATSRPPPQHARAPEQGVRRDRQRATASLDRRRLDRRLARLVGGHGADQFALKE